MTELNEQQKEAYKKLLNILQEKGKQYVYTQGQDIEWFTIKEIEESPYYEIAYKNDSYFTVKLHTHENGYKQFVLKLHDKVCEEKIITQEETDYFVRKEFEVSTFVMECLNEMYHSKDGGKFYLSFPNDGSPLSEFKKGFMGMEDEPEEEKTIEQLKDEWFEINAPYGKELGYPDCCIKEFCDQPPALLNNYKPTKDDIGRYEAGCINGDFTGFIPCVKHSKEILSGKITLASLITNRNKDFPPFPTNPQ